MDSAQPTPKKEIALIFIGAIFCLLGLLSNEYISNIFKRFIHPPEDSLKLLQKSWCKTLACLIKQKSNG